LHIAFENVNFILENKDENFVKSGQRFVQIFRIFLRLLEDYKYIGIKIVKLTGQS